MSKIIDLFKKAQSDPALLADMEAIQKDDGNEGAYMDIESIVSSLIRVAGSHGISMVRDDFLYNFGELGDEDLVAVVGGGANNSSLEKLWLKLYDTQSPINGEDTEK
jgi:hypothetical protein